MLGETLDDSEYCEPNGYPLEESVRIFKAPTSLGQAKHQCTDVKWLFCFLVALALQVCIVFYVGSQGRDVALLFHPYDYRAQLCGVDVPGEFLFYCSKIIAPEAARMSGLAVSKDIVDGVGNLSSQFDFDHPICVGRCNETYFSPITCNIMASQGYRTFPIGSYCVPDDPLSYLFRDDRSLHTTPHLKAMLTAISILLAFSLLVGFTYVKLVQHMGGCVVLLALAGVVLAFVLIGLYLLTIDMRENTLGDIATEAGLQLVMKITGGTLIAFALVVGGIVCCLQDRLEVATSCIEVSCECLGASVSLMFQAVISGAIGCSYLLGLGYGFAYMLSSAEVQYTGGFIYDRSFHFNGVHHVLVIFYFVVALWVFGILRAFSTFVYAYSTQRWYFTPYENGEKQGFSKCVLCEAIYFALRYHTGTLALGGLVTAAAVVMFPVVWILGILRLVCFKKTTSKWTSWLFRLLDENVYCQVAMMSEPFWEASGNVFGMEVSEDFICGSVYILRLLFGLSGLVVIVLLSLSGAEALAEFLPPFCFEESSWYISPLVVDFLGLVPSVLVAFDLMSIFNSMADTLFVCYVVDERRHREWSYQKLFVEQSESFVSKTFRGMFQCVDPQRAVADPLDEEDRFSREIYAPLSLEALIQTNAYANAAKDLQTSE